MLTLDSVQRTFGTSHKRMFRHKSDLHSEFVKEYAVEDCFGAGLQPKHAQARQQKYQLLLAQNQLCIPKFDSVRLAMLVSGMPACTLRSLHASPFLSSYPADKGYWCNIIGAHTIRNGMCDSNNMQESNNVVTWRGLPSQFSR